MADLPDVGGDNQYTKIEMDALIARANLNYIETGGYIEKTGNYTLTSADNQIEYKSGSFTATFPTAVGIAGKDFAIKNSGTGTITVATTSSQGIDGITDSSTTLEEGDNLTVKSNGVGWIVT